MGSLHHLSAGAPSPFPPNPTTRDGDIIGAAGTKSGTQGRNCAMKILLRATTAALYAFATLNAQDQAKFETASVKRIDRGVIHNSLGPATVLLRGDPLKIVLAEAFKVKPYQIVGPAWLDEDCFDIVAKMPAGATMDQIPAMLQALLAEGFKFVAHKEDRPQPISALGAV